ncbi:hypothetical protein CDAR_47301 [Caerostris darwini]|uniref:Uncharacterized protein n=1 Tax=Caerostris darwini TaxID=1538125 RepID=A0AAV4PYB7_9ARAC|nr:hypothetical protein CDAR_201661 [Caerostris darwini]GIY40112.1 hypothetical protein CDAR_47301 [Caerostris darwini]
MTRPFYGNIWGRRPLEFKIYNGYLADAIQSVGNELLLSSLTHSKQSYIRRLEGKGLLPPYPLQTADSFCSCKALFRAAAIQNAIR